MRKFVLLFYCVLFQHIPMQPIPGYSLGYKLRYWCARHLLKSYGKGVIVKDHCYFGNGLRLSVGDRSQVMICPNGIPDAGVGEPSAVRQNVVPRILFLSNLIVSKGVYVLPDAYRFLHR